MSDYKYPRVTISTTAKVRSRSGAPVEDTTVLFVPLITDKGPTDVTAVHSLSEFIRIFGDLSYETSGQTALNVYNWLSAGGTVYVKRLTGTSAAKTAAFEHGLLAKYPGSYYNDIKIVVSGSTVFVQREISETKSEILEKFYRITEKNVESVLSSSDYIVPGPDFDAAEFVKLGYNWSGTTKTGVTTEEFGIDGDPASLGSEYDTLLGKDQSGNYILVNYWNRLPTENGDSALRDLGNPLETPIDLIMDAGYPAKVKEAMANFVCKGTVAGATTVDAKRPDIIGIFDLYEATKVNNKLTPLEEPETDPNIYAITEYEGTNIAIYDQYFTIEDATFTDQNIYVAPSYFLSKLLPYNDLTYGMQFPTAGLRRGILADALAVNENPDADQKNTDFLARINYVEKSTREYAFMSQRTHDGSSDEEYTSLSFLNNARVLEKMKKELERLGREYLFEFNDSVTLSQLSNVLNKYVSEWISNRTLSYALVEVSRNPYNDEAVDIRLNIRFNRTIELISVDITID